MTYFTSEPDHISQIRDQLQRFGRSRLPREKRQQLDRAASWDREIFKELADMGLIGLTVPEELGGAGVDIVAATAVLDELCQFGSSLAGPFIHAAFYGGMNLSENGSDQQKADLLPGIVRGETFLCYGLSEPNVGGDLASVETRATRNGEDIIVNGAKRWCTGADWSDYIYCLVRSGPAEERYRNLSFILIPTDTPGISMQPLEHSNLRYTKSMDVYFDNVRLPVSAVVGGPEMWNKGWETLAGRALDVEKIEITAVAYGIMRAAVEEAWIYAKERHQFDRPISEHQAIRHKLTTARTKLQAAKHRRFTWPGGAYSMFLAHETKTGGFVPLSEHK